MKKSILLLLLFITIISCHKDEDNDEVLPEATQTGAGIFACKVNGQPFIDTSGGYFNCFYQNINSEYYFGIQGVDNVGMVTSINIGTTVKRINENDILQLLININGNAWAGSRFKQNINSSIFSNTNEQYTGELTITKLDFTNHIVSGTFWFNIKNPYTNETVKIREGRFDTLFTE